jgi:mannose-6-phosphate isomerase-like protein (cupin superfamily)
MKISLKHQAIDKHSNNVCIVTEHILIKDKMLDMASAKLTGRYLSIGYALNQECKEMAYVSDGAGIIVVNGKEHMIQTGDLILIEPGEKFYWEGNMTIVIACTPAWTKEQYQLVNY